MRKHKLIYGLLLVLLSEVLLGQVVINEVQYENKNTLYDFRQLTPDWIELYNAGNEKVNLNGYCIDDDSNVINAWTFTDVEIPPKGYLIVFASKQNRIEENELHSDFSLASMQDTLFLLNDQGELIDKVYPKCAPADKTLARKIDGSHDFVVSAPTPGTTNNGAIHFAINYIKDTLIVSHNSGFYTKGISLELKNLHPQNQIFYSLNADDPDTDEMLYNNFIDLEDISENENRFANQGDRYKPGNSISKANVLRAQVFSAGCPASNEISNTYFVSSNNKFDYQVPVVSIITDEKNLFDDEIGIYTAGNKENYRFGGSRWERPAHFEFFDTTHKQIIDHQIGMRIHGRGSRAYDQKSLRIYARGDAEKASFGYPFFSGKPHLESFKVLLLRNKVGWSGTAFKDEMCHNLVEELNIDNTAAETVIVFINGEYWGIQSLRERHDVDYIKNNYKIVNENIDILGYDEENILVEEGDMSAYNDLLFFLDTEDPKAVNYYSKIESYVDVDNLMDYYISQLYFSNIDFVNNNLEMWRVQSDTAVWRYFFFDMDGSMYRINYNLLAEYHAIDPEFHVYEDYSTKVLRTFLQNEQFANQFQSRFYYHLEHTFSPENVWAYINKYEKLYQNIIDEHIYRWGYPSDYNKWKENVDMLRLFALERPLVLHQHLAQSFGNPFSVYPNPADGDFSIEFFENDEQKQIRIFDHLGRQLLQVSEKNRITHIESQLANGNYLLKVKVGNQWFTDKLTIVK